MKRILLAAVMLCAINYHSNAQNIYEAATTGNVKRLAQLVDMKKDTLNTVDASGITPLMAACMANQNKAVFFLLDHDAKVNIKTELGTALIIAAKQNNLELVQALVVNEAKLNEQAKDGNTALIYAVINQNYEMAAYLLRAGANRNTSNLTGDTPLSIAKKLQNKQLTALFLER